MVEAGCGGKVVRRRWWVGVGEDPEGRGVAVAVMVMVEGGRLREGEGKVGWERAPPC